MTINIATTHKHPIFGNLTVITMENDTPWLIAKEVAEKLGYHDAYNLTQIIDKDESRTCSHQVLSKIKALNIEINPRGMSLINESGLYHACFKSHKKEATGFRKWVTSEVLPSLRKTGKYEVPKKSETYIEAEPILNKPHMITIQNINFLTYIETRQIRKNLEGEVKYYTKAETGESGINFQSLANACGGVSTKTLRGVLAKYADPYLTEDIVKDQFCESVIHYFAFESPQKKTKAKELHRDFSYYGIKTFIQKKTDYPAQLALNHDDSLELSIEAKLQQENKILQLELATKNTRLEEQAAEIHNLKYQPRLEKTYQSRVQEIMGGQREIYLSHPLPGRVDLITNQCVVEIKKLENFSNAFGQLLHYKAKLQGTEHEQKTYVVYLFGKVTEEEKQVLEKMADLAQFQLIIDKEIKDFMDEDELTTRDKLRMVIR